jgi:hypothetical protein
VVKNVVKQPQMCLLRPHCDYLIECIRRYYNVCMEAKQYTVLRVRKTTRDTLKLVSVLSHESMVETIDRLARQELGRLQKG